MAKKYLRTCEVCLRRFRARADARTCSPACRKSLQRAARRVIQEAESVAGTLADDALAAGEKIEAAAEKAEAALLPNLEDEAGFIEVHQPGQLISPGSVIPGLPQTPPQQITRAVAAPVDISSVLTESDNLDPEDELEFTDSSKTSKGVLKLMSGVLAALLILAGLLALLDFSGLLPSNYSQKITVNKLGNTIQNVTNQVSSLNKQVVTLRGAAGANGANGSNGTKGTAGPQGPEGLQGPAGADGATGATGPEGPQGPAGSASCTNGNCVSLQAASPGVQESGNISITGNMNVGGLYLVNGNQLAVSNLADSGNIARLNGTGPQTFTGNNKFTGTLLQKNVFNTAAAFQVQNAAGAGILTVDTVNDRVAINQNSANYTLDVNGDINTTSEYRVNGVQISTSNLSDGLNIARLNVNQTFTGINTFSNASNSFTGNGAGLTQLNASNLATGTVNDARLPNTLVKVDQNNTFTGKNIFQYHPPLGQNGLQSFEIQSPGGSNLLVADTDNMRIAINQTSANYTLDVAGTINGTTLLQNGNDVCDVSGNCAGVGGQVGGSGTPGTIAMFTTGSATIGDSIITQNSGTIAVAGNLNLTGLNPKYEINGSQISSSNLSDSSNIARLNANQTFTGNNTIKPFLTGSTTQFQVQTPGGSDVLQVDTANSLVAFGQAGALNGQIVFNNSSNSNTVTIQPGVTASSYILQLPTSGPTTDNCLQTDSVTATQLVFGNCSGPGSGVDTIGTLDSQPKTADGATIISKDLFLQTADATHPGLVSTGTQTFAGDKTLTGNTTLTGTTLEKPASDSATAFQVQSSTGSAVLTADTNNRFVGIGTNGPQATLDVETSSTDFFDGFESGALTPFNTSGTWAVSTTTPHSGSQSARGSTSPGVTQTLTLSRTLTAPGNIFVWIKFGGSSCNIGDGASFKVDATTIVSWGRCNSGLSYVEYSPAVGVGTHTFTWTITGATLNVDDVTVTNAGVGTAAIFNGGNVGIGTAFPSATLEVDGTSLVKPSGVDSTSLFQVQNAEGGPLLNADSLNSVVTVGQGNLIVSGLGTPSAPVVTNSSNQGGSLSGDPAVIYYYKITAVNTAGKETLASPETSFSAAGFSPIGAPGAATLTAAAGTDLGVGTYRFKVTFVTANGETTGGTTATVTTTAGNQDVNVTNIPTGAAGTIARKLYRTVVNGADGSQQLLTTINDNSTTSFLDNVPDGSLGAGLPGSNTATTNNNETSISFATIPGAASYRIYRGTSPGAENSYQTTSTLPFIDTGAAGTAASTPTSSSVEHVGIGTSAPTANLDVAGTALFQNAIDTASAFQIQNAAGTTLLGVDTTGGQVLLGSATAKTGILTFNNSTNSNTASITAGATSSSYTLTLPTALPVSNQCLQTNNTGVITFTSCIGSGSATLTNVYGNGTTQADETITLDSTRQGILIKDNASPIGGTLFGVQSNDGTSKYLDVTTTGITVAGTVGASTGYSVGGTAGSGINCSGGQVVQNAVVSGGIVTAGTCITNGVGATLQSAYDASSSPATITTSSASKTILLKAGTGSDSTALFQIQDASSNPVLDVDSTDRSIGINTNTPRATVDVLAATTTFIDGFETGILSPFTATAWSVSNTSPHSGAFAARTTNNAGSALTLVRTLTAPGTISFWESSTSGGTCANFIFRDGGTTDMTYNNCNQPYTFRSFAVGSGTHTFTWLSTGINGISYNVDDVTVTNSGVGTAALFNGGGVGIGTDTVNYTLDVVGSGHLQAATDSTSEFLIQSANAADTLFTADTTNNKLVVGNATGTNTATTLLVLDNATTDPATGFNGAMYYNTTNNINRCYVNGVWSNCGSTGTTLQNAYDNSTSPATITTSSTAKGIVFKAGASNDTNGLFKIQDSGSNTILDVDSVNRYVGINQSTPNAALDVQATSASFFDGFETGTLSPFTSTGIFAAATGDAHTGTYSANAESSGSTSTLSLTKTLNSPGTVSFWLKRNEIVNCFTATTFSIDGVTQDTFSGCSAGSYGLHSHAVAAGTHTFLWSVQATSGYTHIDDITITNTTTSTSALFNGGNLGIGTSFPNTTLDVSGTAHFQAKSGNDSTSLFQIQSSGGTNLFTVDSVNTIISTAANFVASSSSTATTATTSGTGTNTTTVNLVSAGFANNDVIFIDNAGQDFYTRVVSGGGTTALTVSPAVSYDNAAPVTKYNIQNIGATATDYTTQTNRFFQGYFLGGVVTGAGSTIYSDGNIKSVTNLQITAPSMVLQATAGSGSAFQILNGSGKSLFSVDTNNNNIAVGAAGPSGQDGAIVFNNASNANTVTLQTGTTTSSYSLLLPTSGPGTSQCLQTDNTTANQLVFGNCNVVTPTTTLQNAYDNSSSPATITTSSASKNVVIKAGSGNDSSGLFQLQDSGGNSILNADSVNRYVGINNANPNATLDVQASSSNFVDGFEGGVLRPFSGSSWTVVTGTPHSGTYSAYSSTSMTTLTLTRTLSVPGTISFWAKYHGANCGANIQFYIDGVSNVTWSGCSDIGYTLYSAPVSAGTHTFTWTPVSFPLSSYLYLDDLTVTNAGGTTALFNGGNVGIGTSYLEATLDVSGTAHFQAASGGDSSSLFQLQNAGGTTLFNVDSTTSTITLGSASSTPVTLVLGNKNTSGDPAGTNGEMYYNSNLNQFRCYENGSWYGCGSTTLQSAYNNSTSPATITTSSASKNVVIKAGSGFDSTGLFQLQDSGGNSILNADSVNRFVGINNSTPNATLDVQASSTSFTDGFETGVLSPFTTSRWTAVNSTAHTGSWSAQLISASSGNTLSLTEVLSSSGTITFWMNIAMCSGSHTVTFKVDSTTDLSTGSSSAYTKYSYAVSSGSHTFTWDFTNGGCSGAVINVDDVTVTNAGVGTTALFNGGKVGIGTSFPNATLDVSGTEHFQAASGGDSTNLFQIQNASGSSLLNIDSTNSRISSSQTIIALTDGSTPTGVGVVAGTNTGGTLSGAAGTTYYYKVTAINANGESLASSEVSINGQSFTKLAAPVAPSGVPAAGTDLGIGNYLYKLTVVTANGETTAGTESATVTTTAGNQDVTLTLPAVPTGATGYHVYRTAVGGASGSETLITAGGCSGTVSTTSCTDNATDAQISGAPPASNTATTNLNNATVSWTAVTGATSYRIYRGTSAGGENAYQTSATSPFTDTGAAGTSAGTPTYSAWGALGVGTSTPTANLDIRGTAHFQNAVDGATAFQIQNAAGTSLLTVNTQTNQITLGTASSTPVLLVLGNKNTSGDPTCTDGAIYYNSNTKRFRACTNGAWATFGAFAPGYEISYDQITTNASLTATTEGTATTAITSSSFTFDGNTTVVVDVYVPNLNTAGTIGLGLWLDGTEQFGHTWPTSAGGDSGIIEFKVRVTPGSGSHTFTVRGWDSGGAGTLDAGTGTGGASTYPPAYIRISVAN